MRKLALISSVSSVALLALSGHAAAQTPGGAVCPYIAYGAVLTPAQWNYCFQIKQDFIGYTPVNKAGDTMLGELITTASTTAGAGLNIQPGTAPTSPNNGDVWLTSTGVFARVNGVTQQLTGASSGSFTASNPLAVSFPSAGVVNYALNFNTSLALDGSNNLGINLAHSNIFTASQTIPGLTVTGSFTATGLVTNADLVSSSLTIGSTNVALGATAATIAGLTLTSPTINAGALSGTFSGAPTLSGNLTFSGDPLFTGLANGTCANAVGLNSLNQSILIACPGAAASVQVGSTTVASGTNGFLLYDNAGTLGNEAIASILTAGYGTSITGTINATIAVSLSKIANSIASDVSMNNISNYFDGPSVAQGSSGTWLATGQVTLEDTASAQKFWCKLWDGTTVIDSGAFTVNGAGSFGTIHLSGALASPAGNLRISCRDPGTTTGVIVSNQSGNAMDSTIVAVRIQ